MAGINSNQSGKNSGLSGLEKYPIKPSNSEDSKLTKNNIGGMVGTLFIILILVGLVILNISLRNLLTSASTEVEILKNDLAQLRNKFESDLEKSKTNPSLILDLAYPTLASLSEGEIRLVAVVTDSQGNPTIGKMVRIEVQGPASVTLPAIHTDINGQVVFIIRLLGEGDIQIKLLDGNEVLGIAKIFVLGGTDANQPSSTSPAQEQGITKNPINKSDESIYPLLDKKYFDSQADFYKTAEAAELKINSEDTEPYIVIPKNTPVISLSSEIPWSVILDVWVPRSANLNSNNEYLILPPETQVFKLEDTTQELAILQKEYPARIIETSRNGDGFVIRLMGFVGQGILTK